MGIAILLRFYDLGRSSFWHDEVWVATAALQPSPAGAVQIAQLNLSSPPLDYLVAWLLGRVSQSESWLRLSPALWGIASIGVFYSWARKFLEAKGAFTAAALLALSPLHIYQSQELRYYTAWFFFYWLVTLLLYRAVSQPTRRNWLLVIESAVIGAYFHFFTVLAFLNGAAFLLQKVFAKTLNKASWPGYWGSALISALFVLPGYLVFSNDLATSPFFSPALFPQEILTALGWLPLYPTAAGWILAAATLLLTLTGLVAAVRRRNTPLLLLGAALVIQIAFITGVDLVAQYIVVWRYFFAFLPLSLLFAGYAVQIIFQDVQKAGWYQDLPRSPARRLAGFGLAALLALALPAAIDHYRYEKSNGREIAEYLHQTWQPGDEVWIHPGWDPVVIRYYLEVVFKDERITPCLHSTDFLETPEESAAGKVYIVTSPISPEIETALKQRNYQLAYRGSRPSWVWMHAPESSGSY